MVKYEFKGSDFPEITSCQLLHELLRECFIVLLQLVGETAPIRLRNMPMGVGDLRTMPYWLYNLMSIFLSELEGGIRSAPA